MPSLSQATRSSRGKGKPQLTSFVQGPPVAACYRPPAPATGPRLYLVSNKRPRRKRILRGRFLARAAGGPESAASLISYAEAEPHLGRPRRAPQGPGSRTRETMNANQPSSRAESRPNLLRNRRTRKRLPRRRSPFPAESAPVLQPARGAAAPGNEMAIGRIFRLLNPGDLCPIYSA
jgi:hypothetical protein